MDGRTRRKSFRNALVAATASAQAPTPELVLSNGTIITLDEQFSTAEAVAISGARIAERGGHRARPGARPFGCPIRRSRSRTGA